MTTQLKSSNLANNINVNIGTTGSLSTSHFYIQEVGGKLIIKYGANTIMSIDSTGNITSNGFFAAGGTP
jgi:thiamine biosynthesis protein ThiC